jgi:tetratricopeptide (TPR) repeat protein
MKTIILVFFILISPCAFAQEDDGNLRTSGYFIEQGNLHLRKGEIWEGLDAYEKALALNNDNAEAHSGLGVIYVRLKDYDKALIEFEKAITLSPQFSEKIIPHMILIYLFKNDLPPEKWTQRRVGVTMNTGSKMGGVQWQSKKEKRGSLTGNSRFPQSRWSRKAGIKPRRWPGVWGLTLVDFIFGKSNLVIVGKSRL